GRRSTRARWSARWSVVLLAGLCLAAAGCGGPQAPVCPPFEALTGAARADSLGLDAFLALTATERASRRAEAASWLASARVAASVRDRARALMAAAGMAPDDPGPWLELAELWRWVGDYLEASACLDAAAAAVKAWGGPGADGLFGRGGRDEAALRTAVLRAWLHYDRAEWRDGEIWARTAAGLRAGDAEVWRIQGLLAAALGRHADARQAAHDLQRKDMFTTAGTWILAVLDVGRGQDRSAFDQLLNIRPGDNAVSELRPDRTRTAECYRDMGLIAERVGEWSWARRWYAKSAAAVPLGRTDCIHEAKARRLGPGRRAPELPVWLAFDRHYVTGSLSAYTNLALERFQAAPPGPDRAFWSGAVVNAAGIVLRRGEDQVWALRARGLVFADRGMADRGLADLRKAAGLLAVRKLADPAVEAGLGRLLLLQEKPAAARPHLERALALDDALPQAWSDLGLVQVMAGDRTAAAAAFARALDLDRGLATAWYNRGLMHVHAGDLDAAAADLAEAARLAPDNQDVARLLQQVRAQRQRPR
ncbi:MAG: tetratricopeptide repeat protein, partial [Candidatus Krumholzibacteriia bacterium]